MVVVVGWRRCVDGVGVGVGVGRDGGVVVVMVG